jgi:predicted PurR-regulated permease PerM
MANRHLNNWKWWLQTCSVGLLILVTFAPLPETLHGILMPVALGGLLVYLSVDSPASRRWMSRFLVPLVALMLLAPLLSIDPRWVFFGWLGVYAGTRLWGIFRREHAEYLAQRERLQ